MRKIFALGLTVVAALAYAVPAAAKDYSGTARNIIPSGQFGSASPGPEASTQAKMYDGLTPLFGSVTAADLNTYFKSEKFGLGTDGPGKVERIPGKAGIIIVRDKFNVPHITGQTRDDVTYGAGWVLAEDRLLLLEAGRGPARIAALDVPGVNAFGVLQSLRSFTPSAQAEAEIAKQTAVLQGAGPKGRQVLHDIDSYLQGANAYYKTLGAKPLTRNDIYAVMAFAGDIFGRGGGDETRRSMLLDGLRKRLGPAKGEAAFRDLREQQDPEARVSINGRFPYGTQLTNRPGNAIVDNGTLSASAARAARVQAENKRHASNFLIAGRKRSKSGHPLFVAGPQIGYFYPGLTAEMELQGGGFSARGAVIPGMPYVLIGRGQDDAWSLTSAGSDVQDEFVETLCGGSDHKYLYKGQCRNMAFVNAGRLGAQGAEPARDLTFYTTVHGPVQGYAKVNGRRVAISQARSSRGRDVLWQLPFADLTTGRVKSAKTFLKSMQVSPFTFNAAYADNRDVAMISTGRMPIRAKGVDSGLPTVGTGQFDWKGFLPGRKLPQQINPRSGLLVNWNNKPALGWGAADDEYAYGSTQRVNLLNNGMQARRKHTLASVTSAMNKAATQDYRVIQALPLIAQVLAKRPAPNARDARMLALLQQWRGEGGSRLDRNGDGKIDAPGAAIVDNAFPKMADAALKPVLGPQLDQLNGLISRDSNPGNGFFGGWTSYLDKDLRTLLGKHVKGKFKTRFCGAGDITRCSNALWAAIDAAGNELQAAQGPDPALWRASATAERISFIPGVLSTTMRYTNRPSGIQQVITFTGHRRR